MSSSMLEILIAAAGRTLLLALIVELCLRAARIRHPQLHLAAWTAVLLASLAMPLLQRHVSVAVPHVTIASVATPFSTSFSMPWPLDVPVAYDGATDLSLTARLPPAAGTTAVATGTGTNWQLWISVAYVAVAAVMLLRLALGLVLSWRLVSRSRRAGASSIEDSRIRESNHVTAPVTVGRAILLPSDCVSWPGETMRAVIAHEMSHVAGGDFYVLVLAQLNRAIFWFSPVSWWLHARLARFAELASDDAAIDALGDGPSYAEILLKMAGRTESKIAGIGMARPATVGPRIERILARDNAPMRTTPVRRAIIGLGVAPLAAAAAISIAGAATPSSESYEVQKAPHTIVAIDPNLLDAYAGFYRNEKSRSLTVVTRDGDHLMTRRAPNAPVAQYPYTDHDFFLTIAPQQNSFITDTSGAVVRVVHHQHGQTETLERLSEEEGQRELAAINRRVADENTPRSEISIDPKLLDGYVGAYKLTPRIFFTVTREGDKLFARLTRQRAYELHPYTDHDFFYTIVAAQLSFVPGSDGKASAVILHQNGRDQTAEHVDLALAQALDRNLGNQSQPRTAIAIDPELIGRYVGRYLSSTLEITATREGDQMFVQITGYARYPVYPYSDRDFFATIMPAQISFVTDDKGNVTQLIRHQFGMNAVLNRVQ